MSSVCGGMIHLQERIGQLTLQPERQWASAGTQDQTAISISTGATTRLRQLVILHGDITLDLSNFAAQEGTGLSLISDIDQNKILNVLVGDDTIVDYAELDLSFGQSSNTAPAIDPFVIFSKTSSGTAGTPGRRLYPWSSVNRWKLRIRVFRQHRLDWYKASAVFIIRRFGRLCACN